MTSVKVLHLINGEFYSGAERVQDLLALRLPEHGYSCGFACLKPNLFPACRQSLDAPLYDVSMRSRLDLSVVGRIAKIVREQNYKLLHTHTPRAALIGRLAAQRAGVPFVHHVHSPTQRDTESPWRNFINARIENWSLRRAASLIAVSTSLSNYLRQLGFPAEVVAIVPNGVPVRHTAPTWHAPQQGWVIGSVALFRPRKGLEVLLDALAELHRRGYFVRLRAVGGFETPEYEAGVLAQASALGLSSYIDWTGFTKDVSSEFARMDAFVLPSLFGEGLPMVVIEAMAAGLPVVGTDVEGIPEVLIEGAGIVVAPRQPAALADGIERLLHMDQTAILALAQAGHARQRDFFSDVAMARGVSMIYDKVLGR